jgi:hypothetical protein
MTRYFPATAYSASIGRPLRAKCGTAMMLARIEPDVADYDLRTFECPKCEHSQSLVAKYQ